MSTPSPHCKRRLTSNIWKHHKTSSDGRDLLDEDDDKIWHCRYCSQTYKYKSGTAKATGHLRRFHGIEKENDHDNMNWQRLQPVSAGQPPESAKLQELYLRWVCLDADPPSDTAVPPVDHLACKEFREFLQYVNPTANALLPASMSELRFGNNRKEGREGRGSPNVV